MQHYMQSTIVWNTVKWGMAVLDLGATPSLGGSTHQ